MNLEEIYKRLDLNDSLIRVSGNPTWKNDVTFPSRICRLLEKNDLLKTLDAFFCFDNKPLILFFNLADSSKKKELHKAIWNFNESPIAIIVENNAVEVFNGFSFDDNAELLKSFGKSDVLNDFTYFELVTGKTWEKYQDELSNKNRVDFRLLKNIEDAQGKLKADGIEQKIANALLGKIIFIRYLIDRKIRLHFNNIPRYWTNEDLCSILNDKEDFWALIQYLESSDKGFNGDMFKISKDDFCRIPEQSLKWLIKLLNGDDIASGQKSLFDLYDFSILPIEFISNVYEKFIGKDNQDKNGAYYTPTFIVDYIIAETIGKKLAESNGYSCKVLDPACGSGIFLVESLRKIIEKYFTINGITQTNTEAVRAALKNIAKENIFGIDKDESAIQVAVFSVYLTLLDYQEPADIEKFKFPNLIGSNFFCCDAFDVNDPKLKALEESKHSFDFIIGNPPWKRGGIEKRSICEQYLKQKQLMDNVGNRELAQAFVLRSLDFASTNTKCALVLVSKVLYNIDSQVFRAYLLDNVFINQVFELASVRKEVFNKSNDPAIAPACILFYQNANGQSTDKNVVTHIALKPSKFFSMFKVFSLTRNDIQQVQQDRLKQYDWLWKTLVYGSYLDFIFIKRLKELPSVNDIIMNNNYIRKQGLKEKDGNKKINVSLLVGTDYIKTNNVNKYHIVSKGDKWTLPEVGYIYTKDNKIVFDLYKAPMLLITGGTKSDLQAVSAISYNDGVFKSSLTGIKGFGDDSIVVLRNIQAILNSQFFAYYNLLSFSSSGIEREETHDDEKLCIPYIDNLDNQVKLIERLFNEFYAQTMSNNTLKAKIDSHIASIEDSILEWLKCSETDKNLIDYALKISIPLATKPRGWYENVFASINKNSPMLEDYAQVYINRFANSFNRNGKRFVVEIYHSQQIVGMYFKIIDDAEFTQEIKYCEPVKSVLSMVAALSPERITDNLFVQKDVRGFERDFFYIFKPNERRLWHRAIAHLDVNEFADAMLKAGGNKNE